MTRFMQDPTRQLRRLVYFELGDLSWRQELRLREELEHGQMRSADELNDKGTTIVEAMVRLAANAPTGATLDEGASQDDPLLRAWIEEFQENSDEKVLKKKHKKKKKKKKKDDKGDEGDNHTLPVVTVGADTDDETPLSLMKTALQTTTAETTTANSHSPLKDGRVMMPIYVEESQCAVPIHIEDSQLRKFERSWCTGVGCDEAPKLDAKDDVDRKKASPKACPTMRTILASETSQAGGNWASSYGGLPAMLYKDDAIRLTTNGEIDKIYENYVLDSSDDEGEWRWPLLRIDIANGRPPEAQSSQERLARTNDDRPPMSKRMSSDPPPDAQNRDDDMASTDSDAEDTMVLRRLESLGNSACISFQDVYNARRQVRRERKP